jgi:hypothetical protein
MFAQLQELLPLLSLRSTTEGAALQQLDGAASCG